MAFVHLYCGLKTETSAARIVSVKLQCLCATAPVVPCAGFDTHGKVLDTARNIFVDKSVIGDLVEDVLKLRSFGRA